MRRLHREHIYYSLCESIRVNRKRVVQRQLLHLGELNTNQLEAWQRTIEVVEEDGRQRQLRLFVDRAEGKIPKAEDVAEVGCSWQRNCLSAGLRAAAVEGEAAVHDHVSMSVRFDVRRESLRRIDIRMREIAGCWRVIRDAAMRLARGLRGISCIGVGPSNG